MKLVLATRNADKVREICAALEGLALEVLTLDQFPQVPDLIEDGQTLAENAIKKARTVYEFTRMLSLADDTGLEVDFLDGAPGVYSSRFAGPGATYDDNVQKLLQRLRKVPHEQRTARFRCVIAFVGPEVEQLVEGVCEGIILEQKRGQGGFGYDPVFYVPQLSQTFAEMPLAVKNKISHRGIALQKARALLEEWLASSQR
ncbi:MAG: XTP/dITP diphosphatase [candidate division KSB1 bacterium]|nr:XTP/dITP diphosphatase [candidate division KSB1 bacterium]